MEVFHSSLPLEIRTVVDFIKSYERALLMADEVLQMLSADVLVVEEVSTLKEELRMVAVNMGRNLSYGVMFQSMSVLILHPPSDLMEELRCQGDGLVIKIGRRLNSILPSSFRFELIF